MTGLVQNYSCGDRAVLGPPTYRDFGRRQYLTRYWTVQAGLLTPLTSAWHRLSPLAAFTSGAYFLSQWKAVTVNLRILNCEL